MKRLLCATLALVSTCAFAQTTPNLQLQLPAIGSFGWAQKHNQNFTRIDQYLSGQLPLPGLQLSGPITLAGDPTQSLQAATKHYVDAVVGSGNATQIAGVPVSATAPLNGQALVYNGVAYAPASLSGGASVYDRVGITIDGGGTTVTTGVKGYAVVPYAATITGVSMVTDQTGSVTVDVLETSLASFAPGTHPVASDSITASDTPRINSGVSYTDSALTGWNTGVPANTVLAVNVQSVSAVTKVVLVLLLRKSTF